MKCDVHVDNETIGICGYCGRAVCEECKVRVHERIFCTECAADGRLVRPFPGFRPGRPGSEDPAQILKDFDAMAAGRPLDYIEPRPLKEPEESLFKLGGTGAIMGSVVAALQGINLVFFITLGQMSNTNGLSFACLVLPLAVLGILFTFAILMVCAGMYGFHINYGAGLPCTAAIIGSGGAVVFLMMWLTFAVNLFAYANTGPFIIGAMLTLGVMSTVLGYAVRPVAWYIPPANPVRRSVEPAGKALLVGGILAFAAGGVMPLYAVTVLVGTDMLFVPLFISSWFSVSIGLGLLAIVFPRAPVPNYGPPKADDKRPRKVRQPAKRTRMV